MTTFGEKVFLTLAALLMAGVFVYAFATYPSRQARVDYLQCLSWQERGHQVQCDPAKYGQADNP